MIINLWDETISKLEVYGLTWDDVEMIWMEDVWDSKRPDRWRITKENFENLARGMIYNNDFGGTEVHDGLHMMGHDKAGTPFMMLRNEYDGSEWWEVHYLNTDLPVREVKSLSNFPFEERWSE